MQTSHTWSPFAEFDVISISLCSHQFQEKLVPLQIADAQYLDLVLSSLQIAPRLLDVRAAKMPGTARP